MDLVNAELSGSEVAHHIHVLDEFLQRAMFGFIDFEVGFKMTGDGVVLYHLFVAEAGVIEFDVGGGWDLVEMG